MALYVAIQLNGASRDHTCMASERLERLLPITRGTSPELEARKVYLTH